MVADRITIVLEDESQGYAISPSRVPLSLMAEFSTDVAQLVKGGEKDVDLSAIEVQIVEGSLAYNLQLTASESFLSDLRQVAETFDLTLIDRKRREIFKRWQATARNVAHRVIRITGASLSQVITIDRTTDYFVREVQQWVQTERYIQGQIVDLGGIKDANAHVVLPDGGKLIVRTDRETIKAAKDNLVYQTVDMRIRAEVNLTTGELREIHLIEIIDSRPRFDEAQFKRFTDAGEKAWADIPDPTQWVRHLRGLDE